MQIDRNKAAYSLLSLTVIALLAGGGVWWLNRDVRPAPADTVSTADTPTAETMLEAGAPSADTDATGGAILPEPESAQEEAVTTSLEPPVLTEETPATAAEITKLVVEQDLGWLETRTPMAEVQTIESDLTPENLEINLQIK